MSARAIEILIVDDHPLLRQGLRAIIDSEADLHVCGEAEDVPQALDAVSNLKPDLVIIDISLKGRSGIELLKELKLSHPDLPAMILSMHDETLYAERAIRSGARGYVMKQEALTKITVAIRRIMAGELYVSDRMSSALLRRLVGGASAVTNRTPVGQLSDREMQVFQLIGLGRTTRQIAEALDVSTKTVESHREHLKAKLGLQSAAALLRFAIEHAIDAEAGGREKTR